MKKKYDYLSLLLLTLVLTFGLAGITVYAADNNSQEKNSESIYENPETPGNINDSTEKTELIDLSNYTAALSQTQYTYSGNAVTPDVSIADGETKLVKDTDYTVSYTNNINIGTATATITGIGNYTGTCTLNYTITASNISNCTATLSKTSYVYNGSLRKPSVTVKTNTATLKKGTDYTVSYSNNKKAGTATVTVKGVGNYTGTLKKTFTITAKSISKCTISLSKTSYTYNGTAKTPSVTVKFGDTKLKKGTDYTVTYKSNTSAGSGKVTIKGIGNFNKSVTKTFTIKAKSISKASVKLSKTSYIYNGKSRKPSVTVTCAKKTLKKGTNFTVKYKNNKKAGIATVTITGKKNYTGTITKTFSIVPQKPNLYNIQHDGKKIILTWEANKSISGFEICRKSANGKWKVIKTVSGKTSSYTDSSTAGYGTSYQYRIRAYLKTSSKTLYSSYSKTVNAKVQAGAPTITSVTPASKTSFVITWDKVSDADGYILYRKANSSSKWKKIATLTSGGKTSYTDTSLTYGKTYTYTLKAYTKSGSKTVNSAYDKNGFTAKLSYSSKYVDGYKLYYDAAGNQIKDVDGIIGKQSSYRIKVNKQANTVTVYAKDGDKGYTIPVKAFVCSTGSATPLGTFNTPNKYRWHTLDHGVEGQWCTRITGGILFHSVWYYSRSKTDLTTVQYNKLGTTASAGCCRLTCAAAKWIYDNCSLGTQVTIYNSSDPGPLGKPTADKLPSWHTWDPTDPTCADLCAERGCH